MMDGTIFISSTDVDFSGDLSYRDFAEWLLSAECINGTFLLRSEGDLVPSTIDLTDNIGRRFYDSGEWREAAIYLCPVNLNGVIMRDTEAWRLYLPGVSLANADLRFMNFSATTFEDFIQANGLGYLLRADLSGITYNEFTEWPFGISPPASSPRNDFTP